MLFPILLAVLVVPFACLCLPCFLRLVVRFRTAETENRGASRAAINALPSVKYKCVLRVCGNGMVVVCCVLGGDGVVRSHASITPPNRDGMFGTEEGTAVCPICLGEYIENETLRVLQCSGAHHFHIAYVPAHTRILILAVVVMIRKSADAILPHPPPASCAGASTSGCGSTPSAPAAVRACCPPRGAPRGHAPAARAATT